MYQARSQILSFLPIKLLAKHSYPEEAGGMDETVIDAHEMPGDVGENNEPAITHADTDDNQSELPDKSEAPIDEMNDRTVVHFEQPLSDSSGILEKDENAQAGGNVRGTTKRQAEDFYEQAPVQLLTATDNDSFIEKQHTEMSCVNRVISCDERDGGYNATSRSIHNEAYHPIFWRVLQRKQRQSHDYVGWLSTHTQT